jgi:hypothetical protein
MHFRFARVFGVLLILAAGANLWAANAPKKGGKKGNAASSDNSATASSPFLGRWGLSLGTGAAGWLEVKRESGWFDGSLLWGGGSVLPVSSVNVGDDGVLTINIVRDVERKDAKGQAIRKQQLVSTLTARIEGDTLKGTRLDPRPNGSGYTQTEFTGKRVPALPPRPDLAKVKFGTPITLFNGKDLTGWTLKEPNGQSAWKVENGALANRPPEHKEGEPRVRTANLRTEREFEDFNLKLEVSVPQGSNSGVYLRGIYEIQVLDSKGKPLDSHNMGALYSRITPSVGAEKAAGEWQTLDMTLVNRHLTVVLNGTTIIDNQPVLGVTGGAMWADESKPGPIYLQGDHGAVAYRNIVLKPVVK